MKNIVTMRDNGDFNGLREALILDEEWSVRRDAAQAIGVLIAAMSGEGTPWGRLSQTTPTPHGREQYFKGIIAALVLGVQDKHSEVILACLTELLAIAKRRGFFGLDGLKEQAYLKDSIAMVINNPNKNICNRAAKLSELID